MPTVVMLRLRIGLTDDDASRAEVARQVAVMVTPESRALATTSGAPVGAATRTSTTQARSSGISSDQAADNRSRTHIAPWVGETPDHAAMTPVQDLASASLPDLGRLALRASR
jgi:hypothetical protein